MKLFYAAGSPYARIIWVVLRETGLDRSVAEEEVALRGADAFEAALAEGGYGGPVDAAQIVLGAALENTARRHKVWAWRPGAPTSLGLSRQARPAPLLHRDGAARTRSLGFQASEQDERPHAVRRPRASIAPPNPCPPPAFPLHPRAVPAVGRPSDGREMTGA